MFIDCLQFFGEEKGKHAKNYIEGFQKICKIEKEKSLNTETELFENEIKLLNANGN